MAENFLSSRIRNTGTKEKEILCSCGGNDAGEFKTYTFSKEQQHENSATYAGFRIPLYRLGGT
jgi:hypothetical protein